MGDSNAKMYYKALWRLLAGPSGTQCSSTDEENIPAHFKPDIDYFAKSKANWTNFIQTNIRHCFACHARQDSCNISIDSGQTRLHLEQIVATQILDDSLQLQFEQYPDVKVDELWALTSQELILRYFLGDRYPDILVIFLPFNHAKLMHTRRVTLDVAFFKGLVELYVPRTTRVFYMTTAAEVEEKRRRPEWINRTFENMLATEKIAHLNHVLYDMLEDLLVNDQSRTFGFYDLLEASREKPNWNVDGVHMKDVWYEQVWQRFWQTYCNSV
jgi:hypothetical protein